MLGITYIPCTVMDGDKHIEFELPLKVGSVRMQVNEKIDFMEYNDKLCEVIEKYNIRELNLSYICTLTQKGRDKVRNALGVADFYKCLFQTFLENIQRDRIVSGYLYSQKYYRLFDMMLQELKTLEDSKEVDIVTVDRFKKVLSFAIGYCIENDAPFLPISMENILFYDYIKDE